MAEVLELVGWNQGVTIVLAIVVWSLCRTRPLSRRPAVCHALWMLVLVKLVTPTFVLSSPQSAATVVAAAVQSGGTWSEVCSCSSPPNTANTAGSAWIAGYFSGTGPFKGTNSTVVLLSISLVVTCGLWMMAVRRHRAVGRLLQLNTVESRRAARLLRNVSRRFDLKTAVKLRVVDAQVSPMLWAAPGGAAIVLPRPLVESLGDDGLRNIMAHELAHYVRRDHWANLFGFAVATLLWWNPIAWLARRQRSAAAEACCDALALERLRGSRQSYAVTLLTVVDSLTGRPSAQSAFGIAFGESRSIRRRFEMIADANVNARMTRIGWLLLAVGLLTLVLVPALGGRAASSSSGGQTQTELGKFCCPSSHS